MNELFLFSRRDAETQRIEKTGFLCVSASLRENKNQFTLSNKGAILWQVSH